MIQIIKDYVPLDIVKESLTISRENRYLDNDFKIQASSFPFLIIENENTRAVLGSKMSSSFYRDTYHKVSVVTPEGTFEGELQILSYLKNYRKCNLRFYSPIYNLRDTKIGEFLPKNISTYSGSMPITAYEEERTTLLAKPYVDSWKTFGVNVISKGFPNTLFNLPNYNYPNKYGEDLQEDHEWFFYRGIVNGTHFENGTRYMRINTYRTFAGEIEYDNYVINAPKVYLLAPLKNALESIGYTPKGSFYESEFAQRLLFDSENDNMTKIELNDLIMDIPYVNGGWVSMAFMSIKQIVFQLPYGRRYKLEMQLKDTVGIPIKGQLTVTGVAGSVEQQIFENPPVNEVSTYTTEFVPIYTGTSTANVTISLILQLGTGIETLQFYHIRIYEIASQVGYLPHPIINLQRYVPEWSFIEYLNEIKKLFNLKITPNDHDQTVSIDYFKDKFIENRGVVIDSAYLSEFQSVEFDSLLLKYDNEDDDNVYVGKVNVTVGKNKLTEHTKEVTSKFKYIPVTASGLTYTTELEDKNGVGLLIYNHTSVSSTSPIKSYNGFSLDIENIFKTNYSISFKNYLYSAVYDTNLYLSKKQVKDITTEDFVIIDNRRFYVNSMSYKETSNGLYETKFELLLMLY